MEILFLFLKYSTFALSFFFLKKNLKYKKWMYLIMIKMTDVVQCQTLSYNHKYSVYMGSLFNWKYYLCAKKIKIPRYEETSNEVLKSVFQILSEKQLCFCSLNITTVAVLSREHISVWSTKNIHTVAAHCPWKVLSIIASSWKSEHKRRSTVYASITVFERSPPGLQDWLRPHSSVSGSCAGPC